MNREQKIAVAVCAIVAALALITVGVLRYKGCTGCSERMKNAITRTVSSEGTLTVTVYAYCPCARCNTRKWKGMLSSGQKMKKLLARGINICAADPDVIPMGSTVTYNGKDYLVADTGRMIKGNTINILLSSHKKVNAFGVKRDQPISYKK
jgi:3D (Asp-Asp-Asp) domain-containing protein